MLESPAFRHGEYVKGIAESVDVPAKPERVKHADEYHESVGHVVIASGGTQSMFFQSLKAHDGVIGSSASREILFVGGLDFAVEEHSAVGAGEHVKAHASGIEGILCGFLWLGELDMPDVHVREDTADHFGAEIWVVLSFSFPRQNVRIGVPVKSSSSLILFFT